MKRLRYQLFGHRDVISLRCNVWDEILMSLRSIGPKHQIGTHSSIPNCFGFDLVQKIRFMYVGE